MRQYFEPMQAAIADLMDRLIGHTDMFIGNFALGGHGP
jgi:hypothetical protein